MLKFGHPFVQISYKSEFWMSGVHLVLYLNKGCKFGVPYRVIGNETRHQCHF